MRRWSLLVLLGILAGCTNDAEEPVVALVNGARVTAAQFRERYRSYLEAAGGRDNILLRKRILDNMVNEELIVGDLRRRGLDGDAEARSAIDDLRTRQMLLGYAQRITLDTMNISDQELAEEFRRYQTRINARYLYAATEDSARKLKEALDRGSTFDELARKVFSDPGLATNGGSLGFFGWGEMDPAIERQGYALPIGSVSEPFPFERGFAILRVEHRVMKPLASELDFARVKPELVQAIQKRKVLETLDRATRDLRAELAPAVDGAVAAEAYAFWSSHGGADRQAPLEASSGDELLFAKTLLTAGGRPWSVEAVFRKAAAATAKERGRIRSPKTLEDFAVGLAFKEEILGRARAAGVEADSAVRSQVAVRTLDYKLRRWREEIEDSVRRAGIGEPVLRRTFEEKKSEYVHLPEVNVAEILVRTEAEAARVARRVRSGADFAALARSTSIRLWAAQQGGELGFAPQSAYGPLGEKFFAAPVGGIIGPEYVDPYYAVFRIVGRRKARPMTFDEARARIAAELETPRIQEALRESVGRLRASAAVTVDEEVLANIIYEEK